jgi:hypothetical protein
MKKVSKLLSIIWALLLVSCTTKGTSWDVDAYAPVAETTMDITNMVGSSNLQINGDSSIWLNVDAPVYTFDLDSITEFPTFNAPFSYIWSYPTVTIASGTSLPPIDIPIDLSSTGIELREIKLKEGKLKLTLKSTNAQRMIFTYSIPAATKMGVAFSFTDTVAGLAAGEDTVYYTKEFDVSDYVIATTGPNNDQINTFSPNVTIASVAGDPSTTLVNNSVIFTIVNEMIGIVPEYGKGYLGQYDLSQNNISADLEALRLIRSGTVDIEQLSLNLIIHNSIGAELRFKPIYLKGKNTNNGTTIFLTHPGMGNTVNLNRAFETGISSNPINPVLYTYSFNSGNSNIESLVELLPDKIDFSAQMKLNPYGNIGGYTDFYYTDYPAHVQMQLQAPMKFSMTQLLFIDTMTNPFTNLDIVDGVKDGEFVIRAENKFPIALNLQLYMLDGTGATTDSLMVNDLIQAGIVNSMDRVVNPTTTELIATVDAGKISNLKNAAKIRLKGIFNTVPASSGRLQMYSDYYLKIKVIADIKYHIEL